MPSLPYRLVTVDLDGTLTRVHGWRLLAKAFGKEAEYEATNRQFFAHAISEDQHLKHLLDLAVGHTIPEVEAVLERTPRVVRIRETVEALQQGGTRVALLTHNPSYVCDWYVRQFGFDAAEGTDGTVVEGETITASGPSLADKRTGLGRLARRWAIPPPAIAHVGDGWADAALFPLVGAGIAFNSPLPDVEARADAVVRDGSLSAILPVLERLPPRPVVEGDGAPAHSSNTPNRV
ncbi:MAG: haloacid dehalogenase-like hydrolase [Thermoplasmata archaeon]|nr:haloacid dehalogenase-like hydrolase [Thermoplasmata archaeon]MCI4354122.1 haloacid dehalogenase-like hydrolase [Thermoplasmata archaeon]